MIENWESSGLSKQAFCYERGLIYPTFLYHLRKLEETVDSGTFQQVLLGSSFGTDKINYFLCDGRCVSFPINTPKEVIRFIPSM